MSRSEKRTEKIAKRRADMPKKYRGLYDRVVNGKASPRQAIKSFCLECVGWLKGEVRLCNGVACPLYNFRPYQVADSATSESQDDLKEERG